MIEKTILRILGSCTFLRSQGQKLKSSRRAYVFRFAAKNGHRRSARLNCIIPRAASTISIRADVPRPSSETTASVIGETMRLALWPQICIGRKPLKPAVSR
jgi:hypothetical protein